VIPTESKHGFFVISLDFELFWGIRDKFTFEQYGSNVLGVWGIFPKLLETFRKYDIHATFATVGAMFSKDVDELKEFIPGELPSYTNQNLSPYHGFVDDSPNHDPKYYFGAKLIKQLRKEKIHEIGTHTFSHYYCLEDGQNQEEFESDLRAAIRIAEKYGIEINTFIFPRHQLRKDYINTFPKYKIQTYRGTEKAWYHSPARDGEESRWKRAVRYANYYFWLGTHHCFDIQEIEKGGTPYNIPASMWLRPYRKKWKALDGLRLYRIKSAMTYAAKNNKIYHLWWHPHEMGIDQVENFHFLEQILQHYEKLSRRYNFKSKSMIEIAKYIETGR